MRGKCFFSCLFVLKIIKEGSAFQMPHLRIDTFILSQHNCTYSLVLLVLEDNVSRELMATFLCSHFSCLPSVLCSLDHSCLQGRTHDDIDTLFPLNINGLHAL